MKQTIIVDELTPSLNKWQRMHWAQRSKIKEQWQWLIKAEKPEKHTDTVVISFTRVSTQPMDLDNIGGSFKPVGDALVKLGVIEDDNPNIVKKLELSWQKSDTLAGQHSIIMIEDV